MINNYLKINNYIVNKTFPTMKLFILLLTLISYASLKTTCPDQFHYSMTNSSALISPYVGEIFFYTNKTLIAYAFHNISSPPLNHSNSIPRNCSYSNFDNKIFKIASPYVQYIGSKEFIGVNFVKGSYLMNSKVDCIFMNGYHLIHKLGDLKLNIYSDNPILNCNNKLNFNKSDTIFFNPF